MRRIRNLLVIFSILMVFFTGCDNFLNSNEDFNNLVETEIDYAKAPLVNVLVGHNNDDFGTVGSGVVNYSVTAKVGYTFEVSFALKSTAGNFLAWNAYTKYDPDVPANCKLLDKSYIEFVDNSQNKLNAKVKILKKTDEQIRLVPEVTAFPVMEVCLPSEHLGITPAPAAFNPPQPVKALTPGQEYSITATTTVDYGFSDNPEECWKVYRKDSLGNEIEIADGANITIGKNTGTQLANGKSQSTIYITVDEEFSGRFYVSPKLITYPSMKVEVEDFDSSLIKISHSGTVSMAKGTPYEITLQTDPSVGFSGWKLCKRDNINLAETEELIPADNKTTTNINLFTAYSDDYITVSSPSYEVSETGKTAGKVNASIRVTLKQDMDDLDYSYYLLPQFFRYPVVNVLSPEGYASAGRFSLIGAGYLDNDAVRMMMNDYEYTITYKTTEEYSFAEPYWLVYESSNPSRNLLDESDSKIELTESSIVVDESGTSTCSVSVILKHNFGTTLNIKPVVAQKPSMNISFEEGTPNGINLSLGGNTITSGSINSKIIKMSTGKTYTATVNVPKGYSFEGWRLVRETSSSDKVNWITESTKTTTDIVESATIDFDSDVSSENPADYVRLFNAKYSFELEGRNAGTTKATVDISFKKELSDFSLNLIPVIKAVPEISFVAVNSDYGNLLPAASDVRNLYPETKIDLTFKSTKQATAGKEIWKIKKWDSETGAYSIDYSANVGYTSLDLTAALKDSELRTKEIIIYNNDNEAEVQPNSKGDYITTKTAVLYVNRMPEANLQLSVTPEVYNTIKFVPGTDFEPTAYDSETYIPAGVKFNFVMKTKAGYEFNSTGTPENGSNTEVKVTGQATGYDGISTVSGTIESKKNNGDAVIVTPSATAITKVTFGKPVLSSNLLIEEESAGSMASSDYIYQIEGNSTAIRFETSGDYTYEGFAAGNTRFVNVSETADNEALYVLSTGTLSQSKEKAANAKLVLHDIIETELTDNQGQTKKRVTGTLTVVTRGTSIALKAVAAPKPSMNISFDAGTPDGINLSLDGNIITSGSVNHKSIKMTTGKTYTATVNIPKGYSFEGWRLVREVSSGDALNWITESTSSTTNIVENADITFDGGVLSESPADYVRLFNAKYTFESEGRNAGTTKATVDISFKKELSDFSLNLIPVIKAVPEISFVAVNSDHGNLLPAASDVRNLYPETKIDLTFKSTKQATAGKEIWKIKKWDSATNAYVDYGANIGYTPLDLTAALKDSELITKDIIIYNNDNEAEVQPNSKGDYITTKTAVLYVNKMPEANLQLSVEPEVYNTIKFVPGDNFEATAYDSPVIIPAGKDFNYTIKTKAGYKFSSLGTIVNNDNTDVPEPSQTTSYDGVSTVTGTITSKKNNGDAVVVTPEAAQLNKLYFGKPVLSTLVEKEDAGTMIPADTDFIYQIEGNSTSIRFETTGEYTFEGFGAISENNTNALNNFYNIDNPNAGVKYYVFTSGTLAQAKDKSPKARLIIHDLVETELTDSQGQAKKRVTGTFTIVEVLRSNYTIKPVVKAKPSFAISLDNAEKGSVSPSTAKAILINEDYNISYISSSGYGFEKWSVTEDGTNVPVLTLDEAKGTAGTSATSFVVDLGTVQELTGANTVENVKTALGSNSSKLLAVIYNSSKVESQATEGVETATAKFRIVKDVASTIVVSPVTYQHSYFYVENNANATVTPASTSKAMVKKGRDYDFRIVTNTNYMYSTLSFSGATVANAGNTVSPTFSNYTTQDAVCYNLLPTVNKETGVVTVTGKLRMLKEPEKTIVLTPVIDTFPKITLTELNSGDTARLTIGNNTVSSGTITASMISDYEKSSISYVPKYIDYGIEVIPADGKGVYKTINYNTTSSIFNVYNSTGTKLDFRNCTMTTDAECPDFKSTDKLIIYGCQLVLMENGNYKATGKIRVKEGNYTIRPGVFTQPKFAIQSINAGDIASITFNGQRTNGESLAAQTLYSYGGVPKSYDFSIRLKEGLAVYTDNADEPFAADPDSARVSLIAYSTGNTELGCGYNGGYNIYNKNGDDDEETATVLHEIEQTFDGTNYVLTGKIRSFEDTNIVLKPNVYTIPVFNFNSPVMTDGTEKGTCTVTKNKIKQTGNKVLLDTEYSFTYEAQNGNHISSLELYDGSDNLKISFETDSSYNDDPNLKITDVRFYNDMKKITGKITFLKESVNGYYFQCNVSKGKPGPVLNFGTSYSLKKTYVTFNDITYRYESDDDDSDRITQINNYEYDSDIFTTQVFKLKEAQKYGYQGDAEREGIGYPIAGKDSIKFYIDATDLDSSHQISKVKITERLMYLHPGMVFDYSPEHDYSQYDVIGDDGLQLYDENGNYKADSKYKNASFKFEESTILKVTDLSEYSKSDDNTIRGNTAYSNKIPYGGIHQYTVSVLDNEGNESNQFVAYLDVPRTPRTSAEIKIIEDLTYNPYLSLWDEGLVIDWPSQYPEGTEPLDENMRIVYSAGQIQTSTTECVFSCDEYHTYLRLYPSNSTFTFKICLSDSNGYATEFMESKEVTSKEVNIGNLVVKDSDTLKFYYISVDKYLKNKSKLEPVAVIVRTPSNSDNRVIGAGLYDVGDYPFTNSNIWFNTSNTYNTTSTDGKVMLNTWKTNAPYYSATPRTDSNKTVLFTESNFPAIYKATQYWDIYKTVSGKLCNGWYLPGVGEIHSITYPNYLISINRALRLIDGQLFEYNSDYWTADYATPASGGPRCKTLCTPENENSTSKRNGGEDFLHSTEIHHVRAVFDFTDLAEPWPND